MGPNRVRISFLQVTPDLVAGIVIVMTGKIPGNGRPVEEFVGQRSIRSSFESIIQQVIRLFVLALFEPRVRFAEIEHIEQVLRGQPIDRSVVHHLPFVEDIERRQPDEIQLPDIRVEVIEFQRYKPLGDRPPNSWVWIRHGIQEFAAYSVVFLDINQDNPVLSFSPIERFVPVMKPHDFAVCHCYPLTLIRSSQLSYCSHTSRTTQ